MANRRLFKNFMTVQTSEGAIQIQIGSLDRASAWVNEPLYTNVRCHIQEKSKQTVSSRFSKLQEEHDDLIYHQSLAIYQIPHQPRLRIIVLKSNPDLQITDFTLADSFYEIYEFKGHIEQVKGMRRRHKFFILRVERNDMWSK